MAEPQAVAEIEAPDEEELEHTRIVDIPTRIEDSLIGRNVEVTRSPIKPKALKMTLGDYSQVGVL